MKLNRNNYEEYFILYLDSELDAESRREVEAFAKQNPDLKAELDMLMQSKLTPDADISFSDKSSLMRFDNASISLSNYEEWLTSYIDDELTDGERRDVEVFVAGNPAIQRELNLLQQTKLQPETVVFPYKDSLYRKEEKARVISVRWWRIAAAAVLLLGIGTTTLVLINNKKGNSVEPLVKVEPKGQKTNDYSNKEEPITDPAVNEQKIASAPDQQNKQATKINSNTATIQQKENKTQPVPVRKIEELAIVSDKEKQLSHDPAQPGNDPTVKKKEESGNATASIDVADPTLTNNEGKIKLTDVTSEPSDTYNKTNGSDKQNNNPNIAFASENTGGNNKGIRGFLRKVTRTFEKRTNIKATDDDDRLLIAGLAIKM